MAKQKSYNKTFLIINYCIDWNKIKNYYESKKIGYYNMDFNYSLEKKVYSFENALLWGNFIVHCNKAKKGQLGHRIVHVIIAAVEFLPVIGQIASLFEMLIVINFRTIPNQLQPPPNQPPRKPSHAYIEKSNLHTIAIGEQPIFPVYDQGEFPTDVFLHILSFLQPKDLVRVSLVCRKWYVLGNESLWQAWEKQIFPTSVFLKDNWKVLGLDDNKRILNKRFIISKLLAPCPFTPNKKVWETHTVFEIPNGFRVGLVQPWIFNSFRQFMFNYHFEDTPSEETHCVIIKDTAFDKSKNKAFKDQQKLVATYPGYEIPDVKTATAFAFNIGQKRITESQKEIVDKTIFAAKECLDGTRCLESYHDSHVHVNYIYHSKDKRAIWIGDTFRGAGVNPMMRFF